MRRIFAVIFIVSAVCGAIRAQSPQPRDERIVDFTADVMRPIQVGDSSVLNLLGNVVLYHNGAVITCDSAVRHSNRRMECFHNVLLNKDSTYIYGDRLDYNGEINLARVYSPLIKMVDGDAVMYTHNLTFNTLDKIGTYFGGATMRQGDNLLESYRGYYYTETRDFIGVDSVQVSSPEYRLLSDSVKYNLDEQVATFYTRSYIWNEKAEMLSATQGKYFHQTTDYNFTADSYILTGTQEVWSDTLDYNSNSQNAILRRAIQIRDEEQKVMAFGDYGQFWGEREDGLLTIDPSLVTFDPEEDSLYMRADSMFLFSIAYDLDFAKYEDEKRASEGRLSLAQVERLHNEAIPDGGGQSFGDSTRVEPVMPRRGATGENEWGNVAEISDLQRAVIADKAALYATGDTLTRAMLTSEVYEWMIRSRISAEDIEGQLLYNEYKARTGEVPDEAAMAEILRQAGVWQIVMPDEDAGSPQQDLRAPESGESIGAEKMPESGGPIGAEKRDVTPAIPGPGAGERLLAVPGSGVEGSGQAVPGDGRSAEQYASSQTIEDIMSEKSALTVPGPMPETDTLRKARTEVGAVPGPMPGVGAAPADSIPYVPLRLTAKDTLDSAPDMVPRGAPLNSTLYLVPRDSLGAPIIPRDSLGNPLFAVDSLGSPVIRRDSLGAPIIPLDSLGKPLFAVDAAGKAMVPAAVEPKHDSLQRIVRAYRNVRMYRHDFQAVCDSMIGFTKDSTMHMYIDPVLWNGDNQITSEIIDIFTKNEQLERAFFTGQPMMVSRVDSVNFNQVKGRTMEAFFRDNDIYRHDVVGNAESYYYMMDDEAQEANAFMVIACGNMTFFIEEQKMDRMHFRENPTWTIYPIDNIPPGVERFLPGFKWQEERRPDLASVFNRTIRPTEREFHENMPQPQFPKTERIEESKVRMTQSGQWVDRNETLSEHALEFIRSVETR